MTNKTKYTTKAAYQGKVISGPSLAPVGMKMASGEKSALQERAKKMLETVQGTEELVEKILTWIEQNEDDTEWPDDTVPNENLIQNLSYTKMVNEVNHREPRVIKPSQEVGMFPIWGSSVGTHTTFKQWRRSDLEILGPGILSYLKMLKYWGCCFLLFAIISLPSLIVYFGGHHYENHPVMIQKFFALSTIGNLGTEKEF